MSENQRVLILLIGCMLAAALIAYLAAERPFSFTLVDGECVDAQQQYYDARTRARKDQRQNPTSQDGLNEKRNHADVCAQRRMADAAEFGFWVLVFTLCFSAVAAVAALITVRATKETAKRQLRAYVNYTEGSLVRLDTDEPLVQVKFTNYGQTPAREVRIWPRVQWVEWPITRVLPRPRASDVNSFGVLGSTSYCVAITKLGHR